MRVAAFNVENLFDRVKAFNEPETATTRDVLDAFDELNKLFEKASYSAADQARMLDLMTELGILRDDEGPFVWLRKIRGQLITRPRNDPPRIVARGRDDWVGWCELKTEAVDEQAILHTAQVIADVGADVQAIVEVESRPTLREFHELIFKKHTHQAYRHLMVIDGNDDRGIDVGLMTKAGFEITSMRSHVDDLKADGSPIFSRDCPEYTVTTPTGKTIVVLPNHFKSKFGGNDPTSRAKRLAQSTAVAGFYQRLLAAGFENVVILGDLNDTPDSQELAPLLGTTVRDVSTHAAFTEFEFHASTGDRGIGTFGTGADNSKIDYVLLSPALWNRVTRGGIFRKGAWTASHRWQMYSTLTGEVHAASDHHAIWVDLDL